MKRYLFTVRIIGNGVDEEGAWLDAVNSFGLYTEPLPSCDDIEELECDADENW